MVSAFFTVMALPASANHTGDGPPPASFLPDDDGVAGVLADESGSELSDRFDGTDNLAHLTALAPPQADRIQWRACPISVTTPITQAKLAQCTSILGEDTSLTTLSAAGPLINPDKAGDILFDIPQNLDTPSGATTGDHDLAVLSCVGAGEDVEGTDANCNVDYEEKIFFDDAATGDPDTTAGEMVSICTRDTDAAGPDAAGASLAANPCQYDTNSDGDVVDAGDATTAAQKAAVDALFHPWHHGDPVPNNGFVIRGTTSPDVFSYTTVTLARDINGFPAGNMINSSNEPEAADQFDFCTPIKVETPQTTWECNMPNIANDDNAETAIMLAEEGNVETGTGFCAGDETGGIAGVGVTTNGEDCILDSHASASAERKATTIVQSFIPTSDHAHQPPSPPAGSGCEDGETAVKTHTDNHLFNQEDVETCVRDQFLDPFPTNVTEEISGPGTFNPPVANFTCATPHDHDGDGSLEHCHQATAAGTGKATVTVGNYNDTPGTVTLTSCVENEPASGTTGHGCGNETLKDTLTLTYGTRASDVTVTYAGTATNPNDPCRTGQQIMTGQVGDTEDLLVCTFDEAGNPVGTAPTTRLIWQISTTPGNTRVATEFVGTPPQDTDPTTGQASLQIKDARTGDDYVCVRLVDTATNSSIDGGCPNDPTSPGPAWVEKRVEQPTPPKGPSKLTLRSTNRKKNAGPRPGGKVTLEGELSPAAVGNGCDGHVGRQLVRFHRGSVNGPVVGSATTKPGGDYSQRLNIGYNRRTVKLFFATFDGNAFCNPSQSNSARVRGFARL
jgi:hypothetical protein